MLTSLCAGTAGAEPPQQPWTGEAELGAIVTSGNTKAQSVNANLSLVYAHRQWRHRGRLQTFYAAGSEDTTAQRFELSGKSTHMFTEVSFLFATARYEDDRFSGYAYRVVESLGYGRRLLYGHRVTLSVEVGPGGRHSELDDGRREDELLLRAAGTLDWTLKPDHATLIEELSTEIGTKGAVTQSVTALKAHIVGSLALKLTQTIQHTSVVPVGKQQTDTRTAITLVYGFE